MAYTSIDRTSLPALRQKVFSKRALLYADKASYFTPYTYNQSGGSVKNMNTLTGVQSTKGITIADEDNALILRKDDPSKEKKDTVEMFMTAPLLGTGKVDNEQLKGSEEAMTFLQQEISVHLRRHATATQEFERFASEIDLEKIGAQLMGTWIGKTVDDDIVLTFSGIANAAGTLAASAPSNNRHVMGGQPAAGGFNKVDTISAINSATTMLMGPDVVRRCKRVAGTGGSAYPKLRPIMIGGKAWYIQFMSPRQWEDYTATTEWKTNTREALPRGTEDHWIFNGSVGYQDGVVFHVLDKIESRLGTGGATVTEYFDSASDPCANGISVHRSFFCGANGICFANGMNPQPISQVDDYGNARGIGVKAIWGTKKVLYGTEDYGIVTCDTAVSA